MKRKFKKIKKELETNLVPFELIINAFELFEIYPAKLIEKISSKKEEVK